MVEDANLGALNFISSIVSLTSPPEEFVVAVILLPSITPPIEAPNEKFWIIVLDTLQMSPLLDKYSIITILPELNFLPKLSSPKNISKYPEGFSSR